MTSPALAIRGLHKSYGEVHAVSALDLTVSNGECFGLLGPNGAGKTTTIEICEGLLEPDSGDVEVLGLTWNKHERALREQLGIQLQETQLSEKLTVQETVRLFRSFYPSGRSVDEVIGLVQLDEKRNARVGALSGGQKQRLAIACAVVGNPKLLFLDEPTTGLDPQSRRQLWDLINQFRAEGRTIVLTTHYMDEAERLCDRVAIVDQGKVIASKGIAAEELSLDSARYALRTGRVALIVRADLPPPMTYEFDDTRPDARNARMLVDDALQRGSGRPDAFETRDQFVRERGSRYIDFVVPGLLGLGLMGNGIWAIGFTIVDARRKKLLERYMATPMSRAESLGSFIISRFVLLVIEVALLVGFAALAFDVPVRGSLLTLAAICVLGALSFCALGLLLAARPRTIEGANGLMNLAMVPMWILSGVFFSAANFPNAIQPFIQALPLTAVNDALRANMLRGDGLAVIGPELAILLAWGVVSFFLALRIFRWR